MVVVMTTTASVKETATTSRIQLDELLQLQHFTVGHRKTCHFISDYNSSSVFLGGFYFTLLQCFDTVGWAAGRESGLQKIWGMVEVGTGWSGWSGAQLDGLCLPLLIFPCTMKSRSSLLAQAHPGGPGNWP